MPDTKHTPTPWEWLRDDRCTSKLKGCVVHAGSAIVAEVLAKAMINSQSKSEANAEFIVRACNSHDALVDALKKMVIWHDSIHSWTRPHAPLPRLEAITAAREALVLVARGGKD